MLKQQPTTNSKVGKANQGDLGLSKEGIIMKAQGHSSDLPSTHVGVGGCFRGMAACMLENTHVGSPQEPMQAP